MKHDALIYRKGIEFVYVINAEVTSDYIKCGYFFIDESKSADITLDSQTGYSYNVTLPEEYLALRMSGQFNVTLLRKQNNNGLPSLPTATPTP
jgi:hypothetical protein